MGEGFPLLQAIKWRVSSYQLIPQKAQGIMWAIRWNNDPAHHLSAHRRRLTDQELKQELIAEEGRLHSRREDWQG